MLEHIKMCWKTLDCWIVQYTVNAGMLELMCEHIGNEIPQGLPYIMKSSRMPSSSQLGLTSAAASNLAIAAPCSANQTGNSLARSEALTLQEAAAKSLAAVCKAAFASDLARGIVIGVTKNFLFTSAGAELLRACLMCLRCVPVR